MLKLSSGSGNLLALVLTGGDGPVEVADAVGDARVSLIALRTLLALPYTLHFKPALSFKTVVELNYK